jgi:predicted ATPase
MKLQFENLGKIKKADLELGKLTVICGSNNQGKTYIAYALYGFLKKWMDLIDFEINKELISTLLKEGSISIDLLQYHSNLESILVKLSSNYSENIHEEFNANKDEFNNALFKIINYNEKVSYDNEFKTNLSSDKKEILSAFKEVDSSIVTFTYYLSEKTNKIPEFIVESFLNQVLASILFDKLLKRPFIITAERTGIHLFQKELDINKNVLFETIQKLEKDKDKHINPFQIIDDATSRYFRAIKDNIDFARDKDNYHKKDSFLSDNKNIVKYIENNLLNVEYKFVDGSQIIKIKKDKIEKKEKNIPFYMASSSVRALSDLNSYIKNIAKNNDLLIIDEPELNLHPENQIKLARLFAKLINSGVNILITTHSDYLIKELNNLIMLYSGFENKEEFQKKYKYDSDEFINPKDIKAYLAESGTLTNIEIDKFGMMKSSFDDSIIKINKISNDLIDLLEN